MKIFLSCCLFLLFSALHGQPTLELAEIQGEDLQSPWINQTVNTIPVVVTAVGSDFFFIQEEDSGTSRASTAMVVYTGRSRDVEPGMRVEITGRVVEISGMTSFSASGLEIEILERNQPLPTAFAPGDTFPSGTARPIPEWERKEGMLIDFDARVTGPSFPDGTAALYTTPTRPLREPGILFPGRSGLPIYDGNPEILWFDPPALGEENFQFLSAGMEVSARAVLVQEGDRYIAWPLSYQVVGSSVGHAVRPANDEEYTLGSLNVRRLLEGGSDYQEQLNKLALYIDELMLTPDILALQEVGSQAAMEDLLGYLQLFRPQLSYDIYFREGFDDIHLGFLVNPRIEVTSLRQLGLNESSSRGGPLHNRPPLLLECQLPGEQPSILRVLNLNLRSLRGIEGSDSTFVRQKRDDQARSVARMVEEWRNENLFVVGDFNAFQFTDGYVDVYAQISGQTSLGALFPPEDIVEPPLLSPLDMLPPESRYSFVFDGSAQLLDHCLHNELRQLTVNAYQFARGNADYAIPFAFIDDSVLRSTDHDGFVLYMQSDRSTAVEEIGRPEGPIPGFLRHNIVSAGSEAVFGRTANIDLAYRLVSASG
ncbi:MAG: hypothetical protein R3350_09075, partial [Saprospiraceae bacterium]|nr:hypothetical protein [Saprospiraceae bacterium]